MEHKRRRSGLISSSSNNHKDDDNRLQQVIIQVEEDEKRERKKRKTGKSNVDASMIPPKHVHGTDWKDMMNITKTTQYRTSNRSISSTHYGRKGTTTSMKGNNWMEHKLEKRECNRFIPSQKYSTKCGCGQIEELHPESVRRPIRPKNFLSLPGMEDNASTDAESGKEDAKPVRSSRWNIAQHTTLYPTDSYGNIVFQGSGHVSRAEYARISFDTPPSKVLHLLENVWKLPTPKLIITIHGGITNFQIQPKLARIFRKGILKAARSTDAWIITTGLEAGVVKHVAAALDDLGSSSHHHNRVIAIGVAPWGMLRGRTRFVGKDNTVTYSTNQFNKSRLVELNHRHSYFLLADNGTVGRYGAEIILRRRLESYLAEKRSERKSGGQSNIPVVCVVLEGGAFTIKVVHDMVTTIPRIPVVVCDGSGRAADLLSFAHQTVKEDGKLADPVRRQLLSLVESVFNYDSNSSARVVRHLTESAKNKNMMTVFRLGEFRQDVDHAILTALLKGQNLSPSDQLQLALAWNRPDIAKTEIFSMTSEWSSQDLHNAMLEALANDRTEFVHLLLDNGVAMHKFLTFGRLEYLYNTEKGPHHTLRSHLGIGPKRKIRLTDVGHAIESLMGNAFISNYTKPDFKSKYFVFSNRRNLGFTNNFANGTSKEDKNMLSERHTSETLREPSEEHSIKPHLLHTARHSIVSIFTGMAQNNVDQDNDDFCNGEEEGLDFTFEYPFSDLLIWAVLTKRQNMAMLMWRHGEEALAKSLIACRLLSSLAKDASQNYLELEICDELVKNSQEFRELTIEILNKCQKADDDLTLQLLTYELSNWGDETCISLAALDGNRQFLAHPSCQLLLSDLWQGGLQMRNNSNLQVLMGLFFPFTIFMLNFKSKEELMLQPHTAAEHEEEDWEDDEGSLSSEYTDSSSSEEEEQDDSDRKRASSVKDQPLSFQQLLRDKIRFSGKNNQVGPSTITGLIVAPNVNGDLDKNRPRTMVMGKRARRKSKGGTDIGEEEVVERDREQKRKSVASKRRSRQHDHIINEDEENKDRTHTDDISSLEQKHNRPLSWQRKISEFYSAPITTFWLWSISFFIFFTCLSYTLLIQTPRRASIPEWYLFSYVIVWGIEVFRKMVMLVVVDNRKHILRKAALYFYGYRNGILTLAIVTYIIGFCIRLNYPTLMLGRVIIICNSVFWALKLIDYLAVHIQFGPYITMASEMIPRMLPILMMLFVALLSFGLIRQAITYPYEEWHWLLLRNIFYKPYFMLYGEVYAPEIDTCGDNTWDSHTDQDVPIKYLNVSAMEDGNCVPGYYVAPIFMTIFMLIANVLLMNTMVACCTYVFEKNVNSTQEIWLFERYRQVMEYEATPFLPPPFTIIYHLWWLLKWIRVRKQFFSRRHLLDASLKLFLSAECVEKLHSFEEECMDEMQREKDMKKQSSNDERIHRTAERTEIILHRVNHLNSMENNMKAEVHKIEARLENIERQHKEETEYLRSMNKRLELLLQVHFDGNIPSPAASVGGRRTSDTLYRSRKNTIESNKTAIPTITYDCATPLNTPPRRRSSTAYHPIIPSFSIDPPTIQHQSTITSEDGNDGEIESEGELLDVELMHTSKKSINSMSASSVRRNYSSIADSIQSMSHLYSDQPIVNDHYDTENVVSGDSETDTGRRQRLSGISLDTEDDDDIDK